MKENPADPAHGADATTCLAPEGYGEIIGGSQREDDYDKLPRPHHTRKACRSSPTAGISTCESTARSCTRASALGVERTVAWICGIAHIREAIAFPRTLYKLWP